MRFIQHEYLKISHFEVDEWKHPVHNHNHIEIIFVHAGKGLHHISGASYPYAANSLFILAPQDQHTFTIEEKSRFTFLKFNNVYLHGVGNVIVQNKWNQYLDELLVHAGHQQLPLLQSGDAQRIHELMLLTAQEWFETKNETNETIFFLIQAILSIVSRNIESARVLQRNETDDRMTAVVHYIHSNIYSQELMQTENLAEQFAYSRHHLSVLFKAQVGIPLRDYIGQYRMALIAKRLKFSNASIKEISYEFGFTDPSHFNKSFKKYHGLNPTEFRKSL